MEERGFFLGGGGQSWRENRFELPVIDQSLQELVASFRHIKDN
jgi:hypothetical protein